MLESTKNFNKKCWNSFPISKFFSYLVSKSRTRFLFNFKTSMICMMEMLVNGFRRLFRLQDMHMKASSKDTNNCLKNIKTKVFHLNKYPKRKNPIMLQIHKKPNHQNLQKNNSIAKYLKLKVISTKALQNPKSDFTCIKWHPTNL
jgi:hypothetical protein